MPETKAGGAHLGAEDSGRRLRVGYYLDNFETLLADVERRHGALLDCGERSFLTDFRRLSLDARRLYVRLLGRKGPWFRADRLRYSELDGSRAVEELVAHGFAERAGVEDAEARLELASATEIRHLAMIPGLFGPASAPVPDRVPRSTALAAARDSLAADSELRARFATAMPLVRLLRAEAIDVFTLLLFGHIDRGLHDLVRVDLGALRFQPVPIAESACRFADRTALDQHLRLERMRRRLFGSATDRTAVKTAEIVGAALELAGDTTEWQPSTQRARDSILIEGGRALERVGALDDALSVYAAASSPPARERTARILVRLGRRTEAERLLSAMSTGPRDEGERLFALRGGPRRRSNRSDLPFVELEVSTATLREGIEDAALGALEARGYRGFFSENWLWRTLCGLALWDLVFAPIPGAFTHPYQYGPHDLFDGFRSAREPAVSELLAKLATDPLPGPALLARWDEKREIASALVASGDGVRPCLELALEVLDGRRIAAVVDRLSRDLRRYGSGLPDLFLVDPAGDPLLAEVKGPGDELRPEQISWIDYLEDGILPTVVLRVHPAERRCPPGGGLSTAGRGRRPRRGSTPAARG